MMRTSPFAVVMLAASLLLVPLDGLTQTADDVAALRRDIEALKEAQTAIQEQLAAIQKQLKRRPPGRRAKATEKVDLVLRGADDDPFKGEPDAKLMLVEYSDYQCPYCRRHFMSTMPQLERAYVAIGKVKYVFRDFPLESIHPYAAKAAEAAQCAGEQGNYWKMHDRLFENAGDLAPAQLPGHAAAIGLDVAAFTNCLENGRYAEGVSQDVADGGAAGVTGTPTFFLAVAGEEPGTLRALRKINGAQPYSVFESTIDEVLAELAEAGEAG